MSTTQAPIAVLGAGSWGTALSILAARNGRACYLWGHDSARMARMAHERENSAYLPGIAFPEKLDVREDLAELGRECREFIVAVPSHAFRATLKALVPTLSSDATLGWATKGLEPGTSKFLSEVLADECPSIAAGVISGPTFALEVAHNLPTALTVAAQTSEVAERIADWLRGERVRVYTNNDVIGVQLGGAIKNVIAIAAGISDGLGFGANARVALITRGLAEMSRLGIALGGQLESFMGLAGMGDLILTCTDDQSRNRRVGLGLGRGRRLAELLAEIGQETEGVTTAREVLALAARAGVEMPIIEQTARVLGEQATPIEAVEALLARDPRPE